VATRVLARVRIATHSFLGKRVEARDKRNVIGLLTESHALRRYSDELELRRRELTGE